MRSNLVRIHMRVVTALLACALVAVPQGRAGASTIRYVKPGGLNSGSCTSWGTGCGLQQALSVAVSGDQVWAMQGTYKPSASGNRGVSFRLKNGVAVYGGFAGTEIALGQRNWRSHMTVLSGDIGVAYPTLTDDSYHVVNGSNVNSTAVLDGFLVMYGAANGSSPNDAGGGLYLFNGSPTLRNLIVEYNSANVGGGVYIYNGSPSLSKVVFYQNQAINGGGVFNYGYLAHPVMNKVEFRGNSATGSGGGLDSDSAAATISNVIFNGNSADDGGGIYATDFGISPITNATFYQNTAVEYGGAMFITESSPALKNLTVTSNSAGVSGSGLYATSTSSNPRIFNSIFWGNAATEVVNAVTSPVVTLKNTVVAGGCPLSGATCTNVISSDPVLGSLGLHGGFTSTIPLGAGSSAIDAGDPATCPAADQRGVRRPQGPRCDAGAYEVRTMQFTSQAAYDGSITESGQGTYVGGAVASSGGTFRVGDNALKRQMRGFLSFNTAGLPDAVVVVQAKFSVKRASATGNVSSLGTLRADVANSYFGIGPGLVASDFEAISAMSPAADVPPPSGTSWWTGLMYPDALIYVNRTGITQFRTYFDTMTDGDSIADALSLYSGEAATAADRPTLTVYYNP